MKGKKILILGNGFDLAHGLPTQYGDFLEYCKKVYGIIDSNIYLNERMDLILRKIYQYIKANIWLEYFEGVYA